MSSAAFGPGSGVLIEGLRPALMPEKISVVTKLTPKQVQILNGRHFATVATVMADGSPQVTVVWIETDGKFVYFNTAFPRVKARNLERDNRVAIAVFDPAHPYRDVLAIRGRAELIKEGADAHIDKLARMYTGRRFQGFRPDRIRVIVKVTPEHVHMR
jgi:PPOX class probable F420-dependent enzyme